MLRGTDSISSSRGEEEADTGEEEETEEVEGVPQPGRVWIRSALELSSLKVDTSLKDGYKWVSRLITNIPRHHRPPLTAQHEGVENWCKYNEIL